MEKSIPPKLYKYQSVDPKSFTFDNLKKCQLWFTKPDGLNDPFDCAIPIKYSGTNNEYLKLFNEFTDTLRKQGNYDEITKYELQYLINEKPNLKFKNHVKKLLQGHNQQIIDQASQRGVACFTQNFDSILMWSHYADGHRGLCLEFDTNYVPFRERKYLHQIIYRNSYPLLSPFDLIQSPDKLIYPLITKSKKWKYEEEWRIILKVGNSEIYYDPRALTGIYFGCAMPDNQKRLIAALPAKSAARLCYMKRSSTKFKLERIPYPG